MNTKNAKKYNNIKLTAGIFSAVSSLVLLFLFVYLGWSASLESWLSQYTGSSYILFILFVAATGIASSVIYSPLSYYTGYYLEHKYGLSNQTFAKWILENFKGAAVGALIGLPILLLFYWSLNFFGSLWWLPFAIMMFIISVVLAQVVPVLILPLFYKVEPLDNEELKERIFSLAADAGLKVENVYKFDMSKNTKKANAAFTGLGRTKRIILGDTLLENYTTDEIETVIAHELGHYKKKHIVKNIVISTILSFVTFYILSVLYEVSLGWFGFESITRIAALPLLAMWGMIVGFVQSPLTNGISRKFEYEADEYAILSTRKKEAFIDTLEKLTDQNLGDREPHPLVEWYSYSHPSINKRKNFILSVPVNR